MFDDEARRISRDIYVAHGGAVSLVNRLAKKYHENVRQILDDAANDHAQLEIGRDFDRQFVRFRPKKWARACMDVARYWGAETAVLLIQFNVRPLRDALREPNPIRTQPYRPRVVELVVGPCEDEKFRGRLVEYIRGDPRIKGREKQYFRDKRKVIHEGWTQWQLAIDVGKAELPLDGSDAEFRTSVDGWIKEIVDGHLPDLTNFFKTEPSCQESE